MNIYDELNIGPDLRELMEAMGISENMTPEELSEAIKDLETFKSDIDPALMDRISDQAEIALGLTEEDKRDFNFLMEVYEASELNNEGLFGLGVTEQALRLFTEKAYKDAVESCGPEADIEETSFKMALIGGMIYGKAMAERRNA